MWDSFKTDGVMQDVKQGITCQSSDGMRDRKSLSWTIDILARRQKLTAPLEKRRGFVSILQMKFVITKNRKTQRNARQIAIICKVLNNKISYRQIKNQTEPYLAILTGKFAIYFNHHLNHE